MNSINNEVQNIILSDGNSKIKDLSAYDYLNGFTKTELFNIISLYKLSMKDVIEAYVLDNKSKKELIKYIIENLENILKVNFKYIKNKDLKFLKNTLPKILEKEFDITNDEIPISLFFYLRRFKLAKFEYSDESLKMFMPKEFCEVFINILNDKKLTKENKKYNDIFDYICALTDTYGIIDLNNLYHFFKKDMEKIDKDSFVKIINSYDIADDYINVFEYGSDYIICNIDFADEEAAVNFYETQSGEYVEYSKEDLVLIKNGTFIRKSKHFKKFTEYLNDKFELTEKDIEDIINMLILDYIFSASLNIDDANSKFINNASEMFDLSKEEIEEMRKIVYNIYMDYPKWSKRGAI